MSNSGARDARVVILLMKSLEMDGLKVYVREILWMIGWFIIDDVERLCCWLVRHPISVRPLDGIHRKAVESRYDSKLSTFGKIRLIDASLNSPASLGKKYGEQVLCG